jgi:hypothetical protein
MKLLVIKFSSCCVYTINIYKLPSTQELFISIYNTTCFDTNESSSGAAGLSRSLLDCNVQVPIFIYMVRKRLLSIHSIYDPDQARSDIDLTQYHKCNQTEHYNYDNN